MLRTAQTAHLEAHAEGRHNHLFAVTRRLNADASFWASVLSVHVWLFENVYGGSGGASGGFPSSETSGVTQCVRGGDDGISSASGPLLFMSGGEVITIQLGKAAAYVGAHIWNLQVLNLHCERFLTLLLARYEVRHCAGRGSCKPHGRDRIS